MKILLATGNKGKLKEMRELFNNIENITIIGLQDLPEVEEPVEDGNTFLANAYIKCMYYYNKFKMPVISDDTGLMVDYLHGEPGVHTARYGSINGEHTDPKKNYEKILRKLNGVKERGCHFTTAMYFYDGRTLISSVGSMYGEVALKPEGIHGFGYDPIFFYPELGKTVACLDEKEKNQISHRGKASRLMIQQLKNYLLKF